MSEISFTTEISSDPGSIPQALALAGINEGLRSAILEALRQAELEADDPNRFREQVRWPLVLSLLSQAGTHQVVMENGLIFEVGPDSRIEQALLLSLATHPDHVWEPQTTKLLMALAVDATNVIVGGAYIGDQALFIARVLAQRNPPGVVHAFEPMGHTFGRLVRNIEINRLNNVQAHRLGLWDRNTRLSLEGHAALASSLPLDETQCAAEVIESISINEYVKTRKLGQVELIMLDTEGGEEKALLGASDLLSRPADSAPQVIFELHRSFVDWSDGLLNTAVVKLLISHGYSVFAIRDLHGNYSMAGQPIEIVPAGRVYLEGPPHGFNMLAIKQTGIIERLNLHVEQDISPKLLPHKDPALHHPIGGFKSKPIR